MSETGNNLDNNSVKYKRLRWLPTALFCVAAAIPILYTIFYYIVVKELGLEYWDWALVLFHSVPATIVIIVSLYLPIIGGSLAIVFVSVVGLFTAVLASFGWLPTSHRNIYIVFAILLIIGGVISIDRGIQAWRRRRGKA